MHRSDIIGWAALVAMVAFSMPRVGRPVPCQATLPVPAVTPIPRVDPKPDAPIPSTTSKTDWVLVQTKPFFRVLATADTSARLKAEMAILVEMHAEKRAPVHAHEWQVLPAHRLFD